MIGQQIDRFHIEDLLYETESYAAYRSHDQGHEVRLTRITRELSESCEFRAAFRKDQPSLVRLKHHHILQFLDWGDDNGQFYYVTEFPEGPTLEQLLAEEQTFSPDEVTDIGWQIASALQHAHNLAISHGRLTPASVIVADGLRITVAGFGLYRWIAEGRHESIQAWSHQAHEDLTALGRILEVLTDSTQPSADQPIEPVQELAADIRSSGPELTAREVQGRLGNLLLQVAGESIEMVDHRKGLGLSRRSIVDELFDDPPATTPSRPAERQPLKVAGSTPTAKGCFGQMLLLAGSLLTLTTAVCFSLWR